MAAKVSPVEAAKYTEGMTGKKKKRHSRGAKVYQMAFANLGRNKKKNYPGCSLADTFRNSFKCAFFTCQRL